MKVMRSDLARFPASNRHVSPICRVEDLLDVPLGVEFLFDQETERAHCHIPRQKAWPVSRGAT
jgi:hypothetical protein